MTDNNFMTSNNLDENIFYIKKTHKENIISLDICDEFLNMLPSLTTKHSVSDNASFLEFMGRPDRNMSIIHVAGTNGKGSVCNYLSSILVQAGFRVGMFTSPHLVKITERFKIDGNDISDDVFITSFLNILNEIEKYQKADMGKRGFFPSYFEYLFFMAMDIYKDSDIDYLVLETGLGGLLDVTNVIEKPLACVITEIGFDHMQYLGDTYEEIAAHKAGIIKNGVPVIFFDKRIETSKVISAKALEKNARVRCITDANISNVKLLEDSRGNKHVDFCFDSEYYNYGGLCLRGSATYQTQNAALAISCIEEICNLEGISISQDAIQEGLYRALWPCRMEEIRPGFIVDGAHNTDGMEAFLKSARQIDCKGRKILLFGAVSDKQYANMASMIGDSKIFDKIAVTCLRTGRSLDMDSLKDAFSSYDNVSYYDCLEDAVSNIYSIKEDSDMIFAAGSLYLAGELRGEMSLK